MVTRGVFLSNSTVKLSRKTLKRFDKTLMNVLMFQLPGIAKMFSNEMTLASAWIHLLAVDLFAARYLLQLSLSLPRSLCDLTLVLDWIRQVYLDGLEENIETRHSVCLCLLFCPIGILTHFITKAITTSSEKTKHGVHWGSYDLHSFDLLIA